MHADGLPLRVYRGAQRLDVFLHFLWGPLFNVYGDERVHSSAPGQGEGDQVRDDIPVLHPGPRREAGHEVMAAPAQCDEDLVVRVIVFPEDVMCRKPLFHFLSTQLTDSLAKAQRLHAATAEVGLISPM